MFPEASENDSEAGWEIQFDFIAEVTRRVFGERLRTEPYELVHRILMEALEELERRK